MANEAREQSKESVDVPRRQLYIVGLDTKGNYFSKDLLREVIEKHEPDAVSLYAGRHQDEQELMATINDFLGKQPDREYLEIIDLPGSPRRSLITFISSPDTRRPLGYFEVLRAGNKGFDFELKRFDVPFGESLDSLGEYLKQSYAPPAENKNAGDIEGVKHVVQSLDATNEYPGIECVKKFYHYASEDLIKSILDKVPETFQSWNTKKKKKGQWGPKVLGNAVGLSAGATSHYLGAIKKCGIKEWKGAPIPHRERAKDSKTANFEN